MTDRKSAGPWITGVATLVLIGGYIGAYYAAVRPTFSLGDVVVSYNEALWAGGDTPLEIVSSHRRWIRFFAPAHWLDRRLRPHVWGTEIP
jgi:hypothetical protein